VDVHAASEVDMHSSSVSLHGLSSKGLKVQPPHADSLWLTIACRDSTDASLASHTRELGQMVQHRRGEVANLDNTLMKGRGHAPVPGHPDLPSGEVAVLFSDLILGIILTVYLRRYAKKPSYRR